jgi:hypothetical protein
MLHLSMTCPQCGARKARRSCPALGQQICPVCCGTKREVEIRCPSDCIYLASSREHPAAAIRRQKERDLALLVHLMRDFNDRQSQLLLGITTFLARYRPDDLEGVIDEDVADATAALAATFETASRGVIYDHRPASLPAGRLASRLREVIRESAPAQGTTSFERDTAGVLRRIETTIRDLAKRQGLHQEGGKRPFLDLLERATRGRDLPSSPSAPGPGGTPTPRLIVP